VKTISISSVVELCSVVDSQFRDDKNTTVIYRGLADIDYKLIPKAGSVSSGRRPDEHHAVLEFPSPSFSHMFTAAQPE